jgi:hypothetical protein
MRRAVLLASAALLGCTRAPELAGKISALEAIVGQAQRNGAIRCAPRELATAQSQLEFATLELDQGYLSKARRHVERAEPNAHAALFLSPPQYCARRRIVEAPPADPDTDGDGLFDAVDNCILEPEDKDSYLDDDGCPEADKGSRTPRIAARWSPRIRTVSKTTTAAPIRTTTATRYWMRRISAPARPALRPRLHSAAPPSRRSRWSRTAK